MPLRHQAGHTILPTAINCTHQDRQPRRYTDEQDTLITHFEHQEDMAQHSSAHPACQLQAISSCRYAASAKQQLPQRQLNAMPQRWYLSAGCAKNPKKLQSQNPMLPAVLATCIHHSLRQG
jgi:hypothetical protein